MSHALPVFDDEQRETAHRLLAFRVAHMMGRKLEEADWTDVYAAALGMEPTTWSNLDIDIMHGHLGVEQKALRYKSVRIEEACGTTLMHPSLTRSIRINSQEPDPNVAMASVFEQYAGVVENRRLEVAQRNQTGREVELRSGWLLWQDSLRQFLYFEEPMKVPSAPDYFAEWRLSGRENGKRKPSKNLWIYEKSTQLKRYSVTTDAGAKIQPYFDVPPPSDPNLYIFTVIGEHIALGRVRVWIANRTATELRRVLGSLDIDVLEQAIYRAAHDLANQPVVPVLKELEAVLPLVISESAYDTLLAAMPGVNDDHRFQLLLDHVRLQS